MSWEAFMWSAGGGRAENVTGGDWFLSGSKAATSWRFWYLLVNGSCLLPALDRSRRDVRRPEPWIIYRLVNATFLFTRWLHFYKRGATVPECFVLPRVLTKAEQLLQLPDGCHAPDSAVEIYVFAGEDDKLILCDECNKAFHLFCLRPALYAVPDGEWQCPACQPATARRNSRGR